MDVIGYALASTVRAENTTYSFTPGTKTAKPRTHGATLMRGSALINGVLYVVGGASGSGSGPQGVDAYDTASDTWATRALAPANYTTGHTVIAHQGILYASGGDGSARHNAYDPVGDVWTAKAALPAARDRAAGFSANGYLWLRGGYDGSNVRGTYWRYNATTNAWDGAYNGNIQVGQQGVAVIDAIAYLSGGTTNDFFATTTTTHEAFDAVANTWTSKAALPVARINHSAERMPGGVVYPNDRIFVMSGSLDTGDTSTILSYDPATNGWKGEPDANPAAIGGVTGERDGTIYRTGMNNTTRTDTIATTSATTPSIATLLAYLASK